MDLSILYRIWGGLSRIIDMHGGSRSTKGSIWGIIGELQKYENGVPTGFHIGLD